MSDTAFDGFYSPAPTDVPPDSRWPWIVVTAGLAIVISGAVAFSGGGAVDHGRGSGPAQVGQESAASP